MTRSAKQIREEGEPILQDAVRREQCKVIAFRAGVSERHVKTLRSLGPPPPELGWSHFLALAAHDAALKDFILQAIGFNPLDRQRRQLLDELAKIAAQLPEEGDNANE